MCCWKNLYHDDFHITLLKELMEFVGWRGAINIPPLRRLTAETFRTSEGKARETTPFKLPQRLHLLHTYLGTRAQNTPPVERPRTESRRRSRKF
jgi:hypothetical protein